MKNNNKSITSLRSFKIKSLSKSINHDYGTSQKSIPSNPSNPSPCTSREDFSEQDFTEEIHSTFICFYLFIFIDLLNLSSSVASFDVSFQI